jgi:hypothetical protein
MEKRLLMSFKKVRPALGEAGRSRTRSGDGEGWGRDRVAIPFRRG